MKNMVVLGVLCFALASCATGRVSYYDLKTENYRGNNIYQVGQKRKSLIVYIEGSGAMSVLGERGDRGWTTIGFTYFVAKYLGRNFQIAVPEKLNSGMGENHSTDKDFLGRYTVDNLVSGYCASIDGYLANRREFENVYMIAASEGGLLFPKIYQGLSEKRRIKKAIVIGAGGMGQYACFAALAASGLDMPEAYRAACGKIQEYAADIERNPASIDKRFLGWPYARWHSFFRYVPYDYYGTVDIPVLFYQGKLDWNSPKESVEYLQANIRKDNFEYHYQEDMGHIPRLDDADMRKFFGELSSWLER